MAEPRPTKQQRLDDAREQARVARVQREQRRRRLRVLVPAAVSLGVLAVVGVIIAVVALQPKPVGTLPGAPANLASDGVVFVKGDGNQPVVRTTPALAKGDQPVATSWPSSDRRAHIVTYIDWSCPACKAFEGAYGAKLSQLVASGDATLEIHPIAILDDRFGGQPQYSTRAANVAACVASTRPGRYLAVQTAFYEQQAEEGGDSLTTERMIGLVHDAGVEDASVDTCIRTVAFRKWVGAATARATGDDELKNPATQSFTTPAVFVNGKRWTNGTDFLAFLKSAS